MKSKKLLNYRKKKNKFLSKKILFGGASVAVKKEPIFNNPSGLGLAPIEFSDINGTIKKLEDKHKKNKFFEKEDEEWIGDINDLCKNVFRRKSINTLIKDTVTKMSKKIEIDNKTEIHFVNLHGYTDPRNFSTYDVEDLYSFDENNKLPADTYIVYLTSANNLGLTSLGATDNFLYFFKNKLLDEKNFNTITNNRCLLSKLDDDFAVSGHKFECFLNATWYYPGQVFPQTILSAGAPFSQIYKRTRGKFRKLETDKKDEDFRINLNDLVNQNPGVPKIYILTNCRNTETRNDEKYFKFTNQLFKREYIIRNLNIAIEETINPSRNEKLDTIFCQKTNKYIGDALMDGESVKFAKTAFRKRNENYNIVTPFLQNIYKNLKEGQPINYNKIVTYVGNLSIFKQKKFVDKLTNSPDLPKAKVKKFMDNLKKWHKKQGNTKYSGLFKKSNVYDKIYPYINSDEYVKVFFTRYLDFITSNLDINPDSDKKFLKFLTVIKPNELELDLASASFIANDFKKLRNNLTLKIKTVDTLNKFLQLCDSQEKVVKLPTTDLKINFTDSERLRLRSDKLSVQKIEINNPKKIIIDRIKTDELLIKDLTELESFDMGLKLPTLKNLKFMNINGSKKITLNLQSSNVPELNEICFENCKFGNITVMIDLPLGLLKLENTNIGNLIFIEGGRNILKELIIDNSTANLELPESFKKNILGLHLINYKPDDLFFSGEYNLSDFINLKQLVLKNIQSIKENFFGDITKFYSYESILIDNVNFASSFEIPVTRNLNLIKCKNLTIRHCQDLTCVISSALLNKLGYGTDNIRIRLENINLKCSKPTRDNILNKLQDYIVGCKIVDL